MRDVAKRLRRELSFVSPAVLEQTEIQSMVDRLLNASFAAVVQLKSNATTAENPVEPLLMAIQAEGLEFIDRRTRDGRLWVIGGSRLSERLGQLNPADGRFVFVERGSRATGARPAWCLQVAPPTDSERLG
jgi:hypothetical protein